MTNFDKQALWLNAILSKMYGIVQRLLESGLVVMCSLLQGLQHHRATDSPTHCSYCPPIASEVCHNQQSGLCLSLFGPVPMAAAA